MDDWAIETRALRKVFHPPRSLRRFWIEPPPVTAVAGVDLAVARGELFGLLGPNGAGKTTLIKLLCTLVEPSAGSARVMGVNLDRPAAIKQQVGLVVADERSFYWRLSARHNLAFFAVMLGLDDATARRRIDQVLADVELLAAADRRFGELSTGMRQRLAIARSLLHRPRLLFLDEPARSLDPLATAHLHDLIRELVAGGVTVLLTTHNLAEAEALCGRIAVMHQGRIRACAPPHELRATLAPADRYRLRLARYDPSLDPQLDALVERSSQEPAPDGGVWLSVELDPRRAALSPLLDLLRAADIDIQSIESRPPTLEAAYARLVQEAD